MCPMQQSLRITQIPSRKELQELVEICGTGDFHEEVLYFKSQLEKSGYSPRTILNYGTDLELIFKDPALAFANKSPATQARRLEALRKWCKLRDISFDISMPRVPKRLPRPLKAEELAKLFVLAHQEADPRIPAAVALMGHGGLRISEVIAMKLGDVDLKGELITIRQSKGRKDRVIPIPKSARKLLATVVFLAKNSGTKPSDPLFPFSVETLRRKLNLLAKKAEIPEFTTHRLRHTAATRMIQKGVPIAHVSVALGHDDPATTMKYVKVSAEDLIGSFKKLEI